MDEIHESWKKGERTYVLKAQTKYDGSDHKSHAKKGCRAGMVGQITNGMAKEEGTYILRAQSRNSG